MILLIHLLLGALIGQKITNPILAIVLAFLSHYLLDLLPHVEYGIKNIEEERWKRAFPEFVRVFFDFCAGIFLILIVTGFFVLDFISFKIDSIAFRLSIIKYPTEVVFA